MDYLEQRGHHPVRQLTGGRTTYLCPFPWHSETKPSFIVWLNSDYENFYCFGCGGKHNILHLVSFLEGISVREAIEKLSGGIECSLEDEQKLAIEEILQRSDPNHQQEFSKVLWEISSICNRYLESVEYELKECDRIDKVWTIIDNSLCDYDFEKIEKIHAEIGGWILRQQEVLRNQNAAQLHEKREKSL